LIDLKVNKLTSTKTQLPYEWYDLPFCRPPEIVYKGENLGEVMRGDRIQNSAYEIKMGVEESCKLLCKQAYSPQQAKQFAHKIAEDYRVNWIVDNLPVAHRPAPPLARPPPTPLPPTSTLSTTTPPSPPAPPPRSHLSHPRRPPQPCMLFFPQVIVCVCVCVCVGL
jgi:hypothetical protein